ncbi:hypothetical protein GSY74_09240 [Sulfurovum sp. bin170]|nr:hypothetical protein [Sulfurovum sp. bin170]
MINYRKHLSKREFTEKIQQEIDEFQFNLLESANNGEPLKIDILELEDDMFSRKDSSSIKTLTKYLPIKQKVATFLNETNFEFVTDNIITDETLQKLYTTIYENGIYPIWKIRESSSDSRLIVLYLEVNPLIAFEEKRVELKKKIEQRKKFENHAVVLYKRNLKEMEDVDKRVRVKDFIWSFLSTLYISVVILTILSSALGLFPVEKIADTFSLVALAWPYFLFTEFKGLFILSLPIGVIFSLFIAYKKS